MFAGEQLYFRFPNPARDEEVLAGAALNFCLNIKGPLLSHYWEMEENKAKETNTACFLIRRQRSMLGKKRTAISATAPPRSAECVTLQTAAIAQGGVLLIELEVNAASIFLDYSTHVSVAADSAFHLSVLAKAGQ